jgi:hypothetical protein
MVETFICSLFSSSSSQVIEKFQEKKQELKPKFSDESFSLLEEVHEFLSSSDCSWSLGKNHLNAMGNEALPCTVLIM